jgi:type IV secretory pathway VirD2 relaxase
VSPSNSRDDFDAKPRRIGDSKRGHSERYVTLVMRPLGRSERGRRKLGLIARDATFHRGVGVGVRAAAGLIAPGGGRRVTAWVRYMVIAGRMHTARHHLTYIRREGVAPDGSRGRVYDALGDDADINAFLRRSADDRYQFRFLVSAEDGARLTDLKAFIRDLMLQVQYDLGTRLDWLAADHYNTGYPHTHIVIRGHDDKGKDLVIAHHYIGYGLRARARALINLELGPETELERLRKRSKEMTQERFTNLDRSLLARAKDGVLAISAMRNLDQEERSLRVGRLKTLQRMGLAEERRPGVWVLGDRLEAKLRQLGERVDKYKMMHRALKEAGIDRGAAALALFERGARKAPLIGKVVGVGRIDDITDRVWVVVDGVDGRVHYAELGRLKPGQVPRRGSLVRLASVIGADGPSTTPKLQVLSAVGIEHQVSYAGPTWIDQALLENWRPNPGATGFGADVRAAFAGRLRWLGDHDLLARSNDTEEGTPKPDMMRVLRRLELERLIADLSRELRATYVSHDGDRHVSGIYDRPIVTPTGTLALIRRDDTFTLAPWKPALEPLRGQAVTGWFGASRITWTPDRGRAPPER